MTLGIYNLLIIIIFHRRDRFIATTIEWFHLLIDIANEDTIRSKLKSLNKNLFQQVISRAKIKTVTWRKNIIKPSINSNIELKTLFLYLVPPKSRFGINIDFEDGERNLCGWVEWRGTIDSIQFGRWKWGNWKNQVYCITRGKSIWNNCRLFIERYSLTLHYLIHNLINKLFINQMALQLGTNVPEDHSILKTIADLMVEKVFEAKVNKLWIL